MTSRTAVIGPLLALTLVAGSGCGADAPPPPTSSGAADSSASSASTDSAQDRVDDALRALEEETGARIGVQLVEEGGETLSYRQDTRVAHASTFKALLAGVLLDRTEAADLRERVRWTEADLVDNSPVTERHVADGLRVRELLEAMLLDSDNTAANLLLERVGGPRGLQRALRAMGDDVIRTDRYETELNSAVPGDPRDTSTPASLTQSVGDLLLGDALAADDRRLLERLMRRTTTADGLVRAVVGEDWRVADRSGAGEHGTRNVVAVVRRPGEAPFTIAVLTTYPDDPDRQWEDALVADAARVVVDELTR